MLLKNGRNIFIIEQLQFAISRYGYVSLMTIAFIEVIKLFLNETLAFGKIYIFGLHFKVILDLDYICFTMILYFKLLINSFSVIAALVFVPYPLFT